MLTARSSRYQMGSSQCSIDWVCAALNTALLLQVGVPVTMLDCPILSTHPTLVSGLQPPATPCLGVHLNCSLWLLLGSGLDLPLIAVEPDAEVRKREDDEDKQDEEGVEAVEKHLRGISQAPYVRSECVA